MLAKQSSPVENYLTLFFDTEHRLGLAPPNRDRVCPRGAHVSFGMPALHNLRIEWRLWYLATRSKV